MYLDELFGFWTIKVWRRASSLEITDIKLTFFSMIVVGHDLYDEEQCKHCKQMRPENYKEYSMLQPTKLLIVE